MILTRLCSFPGLYVFGLVYPQYIPDHYFSQHKQATENDLRREFEIYGTIERVRIVKDAKGRGRGYAFVVYERERDMKGY